MFCSIIPYTRSFDDTLLTYSLPEEFLPYVMVGSSVMIPWGKETIIGIVASMDDESRFEGELKPITAPHCTVPWFSASEIAIIIHLARHLFVRLHTVAQLFLPQTLVSLFENHNFLDLETPFVPEDSTPPDYTVAPDETHIVTYLQQQLPLTGGAVILPEGLSAEWWSDAVGLPSVIDRQPRSASALRKIYLEILSAKQPIVFGTRRTLLKRIGHFKHIYILHENIGNSIVFGRREIPLWMINDLLQKHGHTLHFISTTPSIRTMYDFLQSKKSIQYLEQSS